MYLDLEDYRPDTPRVTSVISVREGILISLLVHALLVIAWLVTPPRSAVNAVPVVPDTQDAIQYVQMMPAVELPKPPRPTAEQSDMDRRSASPQAAPVPDSQPMSRGNTPDKVVGAPSEKPAGPEAPVAAPPSSSTVPDVATKVAPPDAASVLRPAGGSLGSSLRNLQQYLSDQNFDNQKGGSPDQNTDIQFDSKGVEFGPWLRRFVNQVKRNWYAPLISLRGRVVIQFYVLRNGTITDLKIVQASPIESFNTAAFNSLKLSNPTLALPPEYPDDRAFFTVTFHYNEGPGR